MLNLLYLHLNGYLKKNMPFPTKYCLAAYLLILFLEENGNSLLLMHAKQISFDFLSEIF